MADNTDDDNGTPSLTPNIDKAKADRRAQKADLKAFFDTPEQKALLAKAQAEIDANDAARSKKFFEALERVFVPFRKTGNAVAYAFASGRRLASPPPSSSVSAAGDQITPTLEDGTGNKTPRESRLLSRITGLQESVDKLNDTMTHNNKLLVSPSKSSWFWRRGKKSSGGAEEGSVEQTAQTKKQSEMFSKLMTFFGKQFGAVKESSARVADTVKGLFIGLAELPKKMIVTIQKTALAIPKGIMSFTKTILGGAGDAIGAFITNIGKAFATVGKSSSLVFAGAGAIIAVSAAIGAFGLAMMAVGKGVELIITGLANGINGLVDALVHISTVELDGTKIAKFGNTLNDFFGSFSVWNEIKGIIAGFLPDLRNLANSLVDISKLNLDHDKLVGIGTTMDAFLGAFKFEHSLGAILTNIINPENVKQFGEVLAGLSPLTLNNKNLVDIATTMGNFLTALGKSSDIWQTAKAAIVSFISGKDTLQTVADNVNTLATIKPIDKNATDRLVYFLSNVGDPIDKFVNMGFWANFSNKDYFGLLASQIQALSSIDLKGANNLLGAVVGIEAVDKMATILANLNLGGASGWFTNSTTKKFVDEINEFANIDQNLNFDKIEKFVSFADPFNKMADAINRTTDALERLNRTNPLTDNILSNIGTIAVADMAQQAAQSAALFDLGNKVVNQNNTQVTNNNVTQAIPVIPNKTPSVADSIMTRGR